MVFLGSIHITGATTRRHPLHLTLNELCTSVSSRSTTRQTFPMSWCRTGGSRWSEGGWGPPIGGRTGGGAAGGSSGTGDGDGERDSWPRPIQQSSERSRPPRRGICSARRQAADLWDGREVQGSRHRYGAHLLHSPRRVTHAYTSHTHAHTDRGVHRPHTHGRNGR